MSSPTDHRSNPDWPEIARRQAPSELCLAMIIFVAAEIMFFAALMSAHTIARATVMGGVWPPAGPAAPARGTNRVNTAILLLSGNFVVDGQPPNERRAYVSAPLRFVAGAIATGIAFVLLQGVEWVRCCAKG
jgi:heme/copper-type cytochrome/quinol oxidase subunit 3